MLYKWEIYSSFTDFGPVYSDTCRRVGEESKVARKFHGVIWDICSWGFANLTLLHRRHRSESGRPPVLPLRICGALVSDRCPSNPAPGAVCESAPLS